MADHDLSRDVYCVLGIPIDVCEIGSVVSDVEKAAATGRPFLISTPNVNFVVGAQSDFDFRETLIQSNLCPPDGLPVVWIARLVGVPIKNRIAGSDLFDALKNARIAMSPIKVFLFGGAKGIAAKASRELNAQPCGLYCVGSHYPGFCSVDQMSLDATINKINSSGADFLVVSLGAKKGQLWLQRNQHRLKIPVRSHLGAVINFQAGLIRRAPPIVRKLGLEWLWRIKEEPILWKRYLADGAKLFRLLITRVLPLILWTRWLKLEQGRDNLIIKQIYGDESITLSLLGSATARHADKIASAFRDATATRRRIVLDFSGTRAIDARFLGLLLMMRKTINGQGLSLTLIGLTRRLERIFRLNCLEFLLSA